MDRPVIAITLGDPVGIGPETVVKALAREEVWRVCRPLVVGHPAVLRRAVALTGVSLPTLAHDGGEAATWDSIIRVAGGGDTADLPYGRVDGRAGRAAFGWIDEAIRLANAGEAHAVATAPINKEAFVAGAVPFLDHTAIFAAKAPRVGPALTMFVTRSLRIFFATRHRSLRQAIDDLSVPSLVETIRGAADALRRFGEPNARLALAALNPHGGEDGLFGDEEQRILTPAARAAREDGILIEGPFPADSVFWQAAHGRFDAVVALYHDQGHIAAKMYDFHRTVSITTGLRYVRSSPDHGTAFDIAGRGVADPTSMVESLLVGAAYAKRLAVAEPTA
ncbi:MAG: 4-hydroxythreonine-4-phosphate dehydrogenase PdxA [Dehalococcoidia bacterium]|nr:4-hydroxythreonine-4-phosphate dehydrogenase PdxA [Dehalococcoidia bacterium]